MVGHGGKVFIWRPVSLIFFMVGGGSPDGGVKSEIDKGIIIGRKGANLNSLN
jgi:hypothetical protein